MTVAFERSISDLLKLDPRVRLLLCMVEYFSRFKEYTNYCKSISFKLEDEDIPPNHNAYLLKQTAKIMY